VIAARFHLGLAETVAGTAARIAGETGLRRVALSGGVMQNRVLLEALVRRMTDDSLDVLVHARVPANDGGLSLGQAMIAALSGRNG
jgi:hydrogenase maturation protein HypF